MSKYQEFLKRPWDCNEVDWNEYESHRPPYTKELYEIIFQYHERHGGQSESALDVGAGGGTVTRVLLRVFQHVIFSDPSEEYISRAHQRFHAEETAGSISFLKRRFSELDPAQDLPAGRPVDMITAGTCIQFGESAKLMEQLGPMLRSGGTVACFSYGSVPILPSSDPAAEIVKRCKDRMIRWINKNVVAFTNVDGTGTGQARYNNVGFDPAVWKDVRRISSLPREHVWPEWIEPAVSRVREGESVEVVHDDFITKEVDYEWLITYFKNFAPQLPLVDQIQDEMQELKNAMGERTVVARWPVILVLATKT